MSLESVYCISTDLGSCSLERGIENGIIFVPICFIDASSRFDVF